MCRTGGHEKAIDEYLAEVDYWDQFAEPEVDRTTHYWRIDSWGEKMFGGHGTLFLGAFCDGVKLLFPVLLLCDEKGRYIDFNEKDIVSALEQADDSDIRYFTPTEDEMKVFLKVYDRLTVEMTKSTGLACSRSGITTNARWKTGWRSRRNS